MKYTPLHRVRGVTVQGQSGAGARESRGHEEQPVAMILVQLQTAPLAQLNEGNTTRRAIMMEFVAVIILGTLAMIALALASKGM